MPDLTESCWLNILRQFRSIPDLPKWMSAVLSCTYEDLAGSHEVKLHPGQLASFHIPPDLQLSVELSTVSESYLDWLDEQIQLAARGPGWNVILIKRRDKLAEYKNDDVIHVHISHGSDSTAVVSMWLPAHTNAGAFHYEMHLA